MKQSLNVVEDVLPKRLSRLRKKLISHNLDAFLISSQPNRYYLTGWQGDSESGFLFITSKKALLLTDNRYTEEVSAKIVGWDLVEYSGNVYQKIAEIVSNLSISHLGFEAHDFSVFSFKQLKKNLSGQKLIPVAHLVEELRSLKDEVEINLLKQSARIASEAFEHILNFITPGQTEKEIAWQLETLMKNAGAEKNAWDSLIVASGSNSSMVHYPAGARKIKKGDQILLDWGAVYQGYHSDISRVVFVGKTTAEQAKIYNLVLEAQKAGLEKVQTGKRARAVDLAARSFLKEKTKFGFGHSVGHGVGLEVHELPKISEKANSKLEAGQVITVEPGIYIPGWGGVRIEDTILVTARGPEILTKAVKTLATVTI